MDIEEDIKIVKEFNEKNRFRDCGRLNNAINHVLAERKEDKKKIKKLEEKNKHLKYLYDDCCKCLLDTIEKQKVKDKIEELKKHYNTDNNIRIYTLKDSYELQATVLEELLEEK